MPKLGISGVLIRNRLVLMGLRSPNDDALPNMWCTPGGGVEKGESTIEALLREFREEVGMDVTVTDEWVCVCERMSVRGHSVLIFQEVDASPDATPQPLDGFSKVDWFSWEQICQLWAEEKITPLTYAALCDYRQRKPTALWLKSSSRDLVDSVRKILAR